MLIRGRAVSGLARARAFSDLDWFKAQIAAKLGINPYPGTFNLEVEHSEDLQAWQQLRQAPGIELIPPTDNFCMAKCFPVILEGKIRGAIILPEVAGYPDQKVEIIAGCNIRQTLQVSDGDHLSLEVLFSEELTDHPASAPY